jgi:hypothetical protein
MDTTEKYIEMCIQATEIQEHWQTLYQTDDDVVVGKYFKSVLRWCRKGSMENQPKKDWIWLPRQEQLQKMLIDTCTFGYLVEVPREFYFPDRICPDSDSEYPACPKCMDLGIQRRKEIESMEQLWLCIVIDEIYTKDWNGTEWVFNE